MPPDVLVLNLDTFATKNVLQVRQLESEGYGFTIVTGDIRRASQPTFEAQGFRRSRLIVFSGVRNKLATTARLLVLNRFHHVELYPAGRMAVVYVLLVRLLRHKLLVIERGDIGSLPFYDTLTRLSIRLAYRLADRIVYKEPYMRAALEALTSAPLTFVHNGVDRRPAESAGARPIDFLWANRIIPQRRPEWVVDAMSEPSLQARRLTVLGVEAETRLDRFLRERQLRLRTFAAGNVAIEGFVDPELFYRQARFFCLPSEVVFANHALLEAMAWGVVPIVTVSPGVELLVQDGVNGIVVPLDERAFREAMIRAADLPLAQWADLSRRARETARERFSASEWTKQMLHVYAEFSC